ncbi:hypothetical protein H634G_08163 [Metarhizium anisopliae BRIP 53293]|uniref:Methyltransferase type 11 domain-containing protein n=1 Tax=Metarhizium anisopliae BRIP 53293 TaxID=1291518 RepID=A0A0D9NVJ5_METAN|nr:hypothetical protein H634G_08163 [Metarhizium anisopliae BRIP 53293]
MGSTATTANVAHETLARVYASSDVAATRALYDEWATTYDAEMADASQNYTGVYRALDAVDMSGPLPPRDGAYEVAVCIGTFTQGHVGPGAMDELVRVVKPQGLVVATVLAAIWETGGYAAKVAALVADSRVKLLGAELIDYRQGAGVQARLVVLEVL